MNPERQPNTAEQISASRLIAEIRAFSRITDLLHEPIPTDFGGFVSVDAVNLALRFASVESAETLYSLGQTVQCDDRPIDYVSHKPNEWRYMWVFPMGESKVRLGIGFNQMSGRVEMTRGKLEFNPNKVGDSPYLDLLFAKIQRFTKSVELRRYDIAVDIPIERENVRLKRDRRGYEYVNHGRGITEYLGTRGKPNYVKLYDKTQESGIVDTITRLELTCDGAWSPERVLEAFPFAYTWFDDQYDEDTRATVRALGLSLALNLDHGEQIDFVLDMLPRDTRTKVMAYLASPILDLELSDIEQAVKQAQGWRDRVAGDIHRQ